MQRNGVKQMNYSRQRMREATVCAAVICLLSAGSAGVTAAYYASSEKHSNPAGFAENTVEIREPDFNPKIVTDYGTTDYAKSVSVENTGSVPVYVRVRIEFSDPRAEQCSTITNSTGTFAASELKSRLPEGWTEGEERYLYYTKPLQPGQKTDELIQKVSTTFTEKSGKMDYDIYVRTESIQTKQAKTPGGEAADCSWKEAWQYSRI